MLPKNKTYPHAMLREIFEQPSAISQTLAAYSDGTTLREDVFLPALRALVGKESLLISASGSSRHAGLFGEILFEDLAGIAVDVEYASEYIYRSTQTLKNPCFMVISQSGETADTSEALREATARGTTTIAITNKPDSSMAKLASCSLPTMAGTERAIPATKSFTTQLTVLSLLSLFTARINRHTPLIVLAARDPHAPDSLLRYEKTVNLLRDMKKQGAEVVSIVNEGDTQIAELSRHTISIPRCEEYISPLYEVVPLQLLAYFMATGRHIDVDNPRNLVK